MGMFSWKCKHCNKSIRSSQTGYKNWMAKVVITTKDGSVLKGIYDGYGRAGGFDVAKDDFGGFAMYHKACYEFIGSPAFDGESESAGDQGWGGNEPFTLFPPGYDPETYDKDPSKPAGSLANFNLDIRETHEGEALEVLRELLPLLPSLELSPQATLADLLTELQEREDKRIAGYRLKMEERGDYARLKKLHDDVTDYIEGEGSR